MQRVSSGEWLERSSCDAGGGHLELDGDGEKWVESGDIQDVPVACWGKGWPGLQVDSQDSGKWRGP